MILWWLLSYTCFLIKFYFALQGCTEYVRHFYSRVYSYCKSGKASVSIMWTTFFNKWLRHKSDVKWLMQLPRSCLSVEQHQRVTLLSAIRPVHKLIRKIKYTALLSWGISLQHKPQSYRNFRAHNIKGRSFPNTYKSFWNPRSKE